MIPKEMKYNLHHGDVRVDVLPPPCGVEKPSEPLIYATVSTVSKASISGQRRP